MSHLLSFILWQLWWKWVADSVWLLPLNQTTHWSYGCCTALAPSNHLNITLKETKKYLLHSREKGSLIPVCSQQQLHPRPSVEHLEATWGLFYHLAAQTHTWHTCQRGLSQGTDPIGLGGLPLETRQNGSSVLHGQLKREGEQRGWAEK